MTSKWRDGSEKDSKEWIRERTHPTLRRRDRNERLCKSSTGREFVKFGAVQRGVGVHTFNPSTGEAQAGGFLSSRPFWFTNLVPGQPGLYRETLSKKTKKKNKKKRKNKTKQNKKKTVWKFGAVHFHLKAAVLIQMNAVEPCGVWAVLFRSIWFLQSVHAVQFLEFWCSFPKQSNSVGSGEKPIWIGHFREVFELEQLSWTSQSECRNS